MVKFSYIFIGLILISCSKTNSSKIEKNEKATNIYTNSSEQKLQSISLQETQLKQKIFKYALKSHLTDNCLLNLACDCCVGDLIFNSDSTFYYLDYCMSDETLRRGQYSIDDNKLKLEYEPQSIMKAYNYENEVDTTAVDFYMTTEYLEVIVQEFSASNCDNKILLKDYENKNYALESKSNYEKILVYLREEGFIKHFDNQ